MAQSVEFRRNREKPAASSGHRSRLNDEDSVRGPHQGQQSTRTAPTGRTHDCKRPLCCTPNDLLPGGGHLHMNRRDFITLIGAAAAWPLAARAQQPIGKMRHLGVLLPGLPTSSLGKATRDRLGELGYTEGRDIILETRWAEGKVERLTELAAELASLKVDAIITFSTPAAIAARKATTTIPIIFVYVGDPVGAGVVPSLARPGGNATGITLLATELSAKRLEILLEIAPKTSHVAMLWNDTNTGMVLRAREAQDAAAKRAVMIKSVGVHDLISFDSAFAMIDSKPIDALLTLVDPFTSQHRQRIVDFADKR